MTDKHTDRQTNIRTFRLIERNGPEGQFFENCTILSAWLLARAPGSRGVVDTWQQRCTWQPGASSALHHCARLVVVVELLVFSTTTALASGTTLASEQGH